MRKALLVIELPTSCFDCPCSHFAYCRTIACGVTGKTISAPDCEETRLDSCPLILVPPYGRLIDANKIRLTDFEIILCQKKKGNPFKNALEILLEKIENAPNIIQADGKDTNVPTREEGE